MAGLGCFVSLGSELTTRTYGNRLYHVDENAHGLGDQGIKK